MDVKSLGLCTIVVEIGEAGRPVEERLQRVAEQLERLRMRPLAITCTAGDLSQFGMAWNAWTAHNGRWRLIATGDSECVVRELVAGAGDVVLLPRGQRP
jgi:hypothetical protein